MDVCKGFYLSNSKAGFVLNGLGAVSTGGSGGIVSGLHEQLLVSGSPWPPFQKKAGLTSFTIFLYSIEMYYHFCPNGS